MRKRRLRKPIQNVLVVIEIIMFISAFSVDSIELSYVPLWFLVIALVIVNGYVLSKYGDLLED